MDRTITINRLVNYRASATTAVRRCLEERGAVETRTPMLSTYPDLAPMRQLLTRHPSSKEIYCLRIAPEEHLTRLIALGVPAVYEIATNFRCDNVDETHLMEFESIEALFSGASITDMLDLMETACRAVAAVAQRNESGSIWELPATVFPRVRIPEWIEDNMAMSPSNLISLSGLKEIATRLGCNINTASMSQLMDSIISSIATKLGGAVFVGIFPSFLGGPAAREPNMPEFITRYELYYNGLELGSAAQQLRDIDDWDRRYKHNFELKKEQGIEPNIVNLELLNEIPTLPEFAGMGLGFERMLALGIGMNDIRKVRIFDN